MQSCLSLLYWHYSMKCLLSSYSDFKAKEISLAKKEEALKQKQADIEKKIEERVKTESAKKEKEIKRQVGEDYEAQNKALSEETTEAKKQVQELRTTKSENEQL